MLKFKVELDLGNEAMQTLHNVNSALQWSLANYARANGRRDGGFDMTLIEGDEGVLRDENGNTVGRWEVVEA